MFTGIITATAPVKQAQEERGLYRVTMGKPKGWKLALGESISVDGICSTVVKKDANTFTVQYIPETLMKTTAGNFVKGSIRNLERSLTLKTLIDGHILQGHVDTRAKVANVEHKGGAYLLTIELPKNLLKFVAEHGSIGLNGVSLTVARRKGTQATIALIPHTLTHTNLGSLRKGSEVNVEVDLIARYLVNAQRYAK
ncbi:MAG TPA: riboflavin synthase [Candidatus Paceibacterota bacterium]|nr:riboflavin synthase [Candidatus Paceibacterota bacterium]